MSLATGLPLLLLVLQSTELAAPYRVGVGDVLEVAVEGRPDLSRLPTVQTTGTVWVPRAGEVPVRGLTVEEIAARVAPRLAAEDLPQPRVSVRVREYQSQFVWVRGAVNRPGRKPLRAGSRLVDALLDAGGFQQGASGELTVERASGFADGGRELRLRFSGREPTPEELQQLSLPLAAGDVITATTQQWVSVSGAVRRPGRYPWDGGLSVARLVEKAGGLVRGAREEVQLRRRGEPAGQEVEADLGAIREGRAEDPLLAPGDEVAVRARRP